MSLTLLLAGHFLLVYQTHVVHIYLPVDVKPILSTLYGPLIYWLCIAWVFPKQGGNRRHLRFLGPAVVVVMIQLAGLGGFQQPSGIAVRLFVYGYTFYWLFRSIVLLFGELSTGRSHLCWLYHAVVVFTALTTLGMVDLVRVIVWPGSSQDVLVVGVFVLGLALVGLFLFRRLIYPMVEYGLPESRVSDTSKTMQSKVAVKRLTMIDSAGETEQADLADRLSVLFEDDELFLVAGLTLNRVAQQLDVKPYLLSRTINHQLGTSFPAFVNAYRVERAKVLLHDTSHKMLAVALESGFSNKASFYRTFKRATGMTPLTYRNEARDAQ